MHEILPIASGLVLGGLLAATRVPSFLRAILVVIIGACATIGSGEFRLSWSFLMLDILEVALASAAAWMVVTLWRRNLAHRR
jgi:hypothetical protein